MSLCGSSIEQGKTQNFRVIKEQSLCKIAKKSHFMPKRNYHSTKVSGNLEPISTETHTGRCAIKKRALSEGVRGSNAETAIASHDQLHRIRLCS